MRNLLDEDGVGIDSVGTVNCLEVCRPTDFGSKSGPPEICAAARQHEPCQHNDDDARRPQRCTSTTRRLHDAHNACNTIAVYHSNAQTRHEVSGRGDTWAEGLDHIPTKTVRGVIRRAGRAFVQTDLPEAWVYIHGDSVKCLIDTGA